MNVPSESAELRAQLPWEERQRIGAWRGYFDTLIPSLLQPQRFFTVLADASGPEGLRDSLRFDLITHFIGSAGFAIFYGAVFLTSPPEALAAISVLGRLAMVLGFFFVSGPAGVLFDLAYAVIVHGALLFLGQAPAGLRGTIRAVMYGGGAMALNCTLLLTVFFIPALWGTYCTIIALAHAQRLSRGQALTAVIVPTGVLIMVGAVVMALGMSMAMEKLNAMGFIPAGVPT